jgi:hypothetical protein
MTDAEKFSLLEAVNIEAKTAGVGGYVLPIHAAPICSSR